MDTSDADEEESKQTSHGKVSDADSMPQAPSASAPSSITPLSAACGGDNVHLSEVPMEALSPQPADASGNCLSTASASWAEDAELETMRVDGAADGASPSVAPTSEHSL